jgi:uncharacterized protein YbaP (TraB family)
MNFLWWKKKRLKTVWRVDKDGHTSFLVGTAHFSPYSFKRALIKLIQSVDIILFEGPLDQESMAKVVQYGQQQGEDTRSIYEALDPVVVKEINRQLGARSSLPTTAGSYLNILYPTSSDFLEVHTRGVRPWMAFFIIWSAFLNWKHSMDVEAFNIAQKLGKKIQYLETIEDQLAALDGVPFERIVNYLNHIEHWKAHKEAFMKAFLEGNIQQFYTMTGEFPTRCDSILTQRNPIFFKRMKTFFEEGKTAAFVGVAHIPGIRDMFLNEGYLVTQEES